MKPSAPALWASSASIASASRSNLSVGPGREIAASETQRTAVLRASKAVSWARRGFEVGTKRATSFASSLLSELALLAGIAYGFRSPILLTILERIPYALASGRERREHPPAIHWVVDSESAITGSFGSKEFVCRANFARTARDDSRGRNQPGGSDPIALSCIMDCVQCSVAAACQPWTVSARSRAVGGQVISAEGWVNSR